MTEDNDERFREFINGYCANVMKGFDTRWSQVKPEIFNRHIHECIGGLLSRQATLSIQMALAPSVWNGHVAPLFLRCQTDAYITLAWVFGDPEPRSKQYILYGLGQEKLYIEYLEQALQDDPDGYDSDRIRELIEIRRSWLQGQLAEWATEVSVGSWSGMSTRDMAAEVGIESIYKYAYVPFSGPAHNMWQHVGIYNMEPCENPLHKWHLVPKIRHSPMHPDFMYRSAKYVTRTYELFDEKMGITSEVEMPVDYFLNQAIPPDVADDSAGDGDS